MRISSELSASQMTSKSAVFLIAVIIALSSSARAQILPREDKTPDAGMEDLYDKFENQESKNAQKKTQESKKEKAEAKPNVEPNKLSELGRLSPFEDIAVIQKRFLPKTGRFEVGGGGSFSTNNAFFNDIGANLRLGYYFNEKYGIEGMYQYISSSKRPITSGLIDHQNIQTESLVEPKGFYGAMFKWSPIYGKMAWFQQKIVPFDIYFTPGIGMTQTATGGSNSMVMLGAGQLFAMSKAFALRWDFNWNYYSSSVNVTTGGVTSKETTTHSDLFLGVGVSFFFPEATYR
jgi:outer membrane beta-barrel protein